MNTFEGGKSLKRLREKHKMTQPDLAKASGVRQQKISALEKGLIQDPNMEDLVKLGRVFGLDANQIAALYEI